jgi:hypothetical protein
MHTNKTFIIIFKNIFLTIAHKNINKNFNLKQNKSKSREIPVTPDTNSPEISYPPNIFTG